MKRVNVLLTGAGGFLGKALSDELFQKGFTVSGVYRTPSTQQSHQISSVITDLMSLTSEDSSNQNQVKELERHLSQCDVVVHAAAITPYNKPVGVSYNDFNVGVTIELAKRALAAGVKRFVYISSVGVYGDLTLCPVTELDDVAPQNEYSLSKLTAELSLAKLIRGSQMELVIIRPPMVYGLGSQGSFNMLSKLVLKSMPLPLLSVKNKRDFIAVDNLVDFISLCSDISSSPSAKNETFLISDGESVSTSELVNRICTANNCRPAMFHFPVKILIFFLNLLGKKGIANSLFCDFQVDSSKAKNKLGWEPVTTMECELKKIAGAEKKGISRD